MPDTKDVKSTWLQRHGVHYWHWVRYPWFAGGRLLDPFHEPHWTTEIEAPYRHGLGRSVRLFGPLGIAWGRWVAPEEQQRYIPKERQPGEERGAVARIVYWFRYRQADHAIRRGTRVDPGTVVTVNPYREALDAEDVPLEHL